MDFAVLMNQRSPRNFRWVGGQYKVHVQIRKGLFYRRRGHDGFELFDRA